MHEDKERLKKETGAATQCKWSGRRLIELAASGPAPFVNALRALSADSDYASGKAMRKLRQLNLESQVTKILDGFATAKNMLEARFVQYVTFLSRPPWNLVALLGYLLPTSDLEEAIAKSRARASAMLAAHESNRLGNLGDVGKQFFLDHKISLIRWARGLDRFMNQHLFRQLLAWASSLLVMKRLEAKHHLVHVTWIVLVENNIPIYLTPNADQNSKLN